MVNVNIPQGKRCNLFTNLVAMTACFKYLEKAGIVVLCCSCSLVKPFHPKIPCGMSCFHPGIKKLTKFNRLPNLSGKARGPRQHEEGINCPLGHLNRLPEGGSGGSQVCRGYSVHLCIPDLLWQPTDLSTHLLALLFFVCHCGQVMGQAPALDVFPAFRCLSREGVDGGE